MLSRLLGCIEGAGLIDHLFIIDNSPIVTNYSLFNFSWISYIHLDKNLGYGAAHNIALSKVLFKSKFHFVLNPDIYFEHNQINIMLIRMCKDEEIGLLMPKVLYPDGSIQYLCKLIPSPADLLYRRFLPKIFNSMVKGKMDEFELRFTGYQTEMDVPILSGCFMLFRVSALQKIGLFDEQYFMYAEDFDISRRMHEEFRTIFFPTASITHDHARESYRNFKMLLIHLRSLIQYFSKWGWFFDNKRYVVNTHILKKLKAPF